MKRRTDAQGRRGGIPQEPSDRSCASGWLPSPVAPAARYPHHFPVVEVQQTILNNIPRVADAERFKAIAGRRIVESSATGS